MLEHLKVSNVALIREASIDFAPGLNILTGETGAGKSILIDSINFVLGARASKEFIRTGADVATVEAFITVSHNQLVEQISRLGIDIGEDRALLLFRSQNTAGKQTAKINGRPVTISMLKEISAVLVDIHGQHEHQSLLNPAKHLQLLDRFCQEDLLPQKTQLAEYITAYKTLLAAIKTIPGQNADQSQTADVYKFQIEEISATGLATDEEERLTQRRKMLTNREKITNGAVAARALLSADGGVLDNLARVVEHTAAVAAYDTAQKDTATRLADLYAQLADISQDFARYADNLEHNPWELEEIEARLDQIYRLKQKYGRNVPQLLEYAQELVQKLHTIENGQQELAQLVAEKKALEKEIGRTCLAMSKIRREAAATLGGQIETTLRQLSMEAASFAIDVQSRSEFGRDGFDRVEFMISANKGEAPKPLSDIASGGEMSRVMLALKTALAGYDTIETFIFDEIDAGISGRTAQQVAQKLAVIAQNHQILCITHLPQIAAMGDANFYIEKTPADGRTVTHIHRLEEADTIKAIAQLIGGAEITDTTTKAAEEMRRLAHGSKKEAR
ncbi:MAG: DNA repair protein RecN [Defluviitaleaceae bacterium]|nr:DNA repair protein RecN [Defluviitaleaceae bacterium]